MSDNAPNNGPSARIRRASPTEAERGGTPRWQSLGLLLGGFTTLDDGFGPEPADPLDAPTLVEAVVPRRMTEAERAMVTVQDAGYEPREPYPGRADYAWRLRCTMPSCGRLTARTLHYIRRHGGCTHDRP
ncbi:hypothetical protein [Streptomyces palmae]|uniref:Uncharacterized protein n=1 Tax=Streptomyces palmae TaxID=1701085 RepID=A0A4Z0HCC9_9ACTN|nr:hypothetical protein [Streptomyces palmae]TGB17286.1 hypothetical protein E4099_03855 [Streptomyces palmae]